MQVPQDYSFNFLNQGGVVLFFHPIYSRTKSITHPQLMIHSIYQLKKKRKISQINIKFIVTHKFNDMLI